MEAMAPAMTLAIRKLKNWYGVTPLNMVLKVS
jgi:hypothetical protein